MGLLSPDLSIYQNAPRSLIREGLMGYDNAQQAKTQAMEQRGLMAQQGQQAKTFEQQQAEYQRTQKFQQAFRGLSQVNGSTPEGMQKTVQDLDRLGFGPEAMEIAQKIPKPAQKAYQSVETDQGMTAFDPQTGTYAAPTQVNGKPLMKQFKPEAPKPERFQLVKNKKGQMESVDVSTGLNAKGQPVEAWQDPQKPDGPKPTDVFSQEQQLRTQYLGQTKDFRDVRDAYGRIKTSTKVPTAAGDLSLIYNFMKMQDPGSTVRETEFAAAAASGSYGDRLKAAGEKILSGQRLSPDQRADFLGQAQKLYGAAEFQKKKTLTGYRKLANQYPGLNADRAFTDDDMAVDPAEPAAAGGMPTHEQYDTLPSGAEYTDPQGNVRRKK